MTANEIKQLRDLTLIFQIHLRRVYWERMTQSSGQWDFAHLMERRRTDSELCDQMLELIGEYIPQRIFSAMAKSLE